MDGGVTLLDADEDDNVTATVRGDDADLVEDRSKWRLGDKGIG